MLLKFPPISQYFILKGEMIHLDAFDSLQEQVHGKIDTAESHPRRVSVRLEPLPGAKDLREEKQSQKVRLEPPKNGMLLKMIFQFIFWDDFQVLC